MSNDKKFPSGGRDYYTDLTIDEILEYASKNEGKFECKKGLDPIYKRLFMIVIITVVVSIGVMLVEMKTAPKHSSTEKQEEIVEQHSEVQNEAEEAEKELQKNGLGIDNVGVNVPEDEFILRDSGRSYLFDKDIYGFTAEQCILARSEIYARYGCRFENSEIQKHFDECSWYVPRYEVGEFDESVLNSYDITNRDFIIQYEEEQGFR